MAYTAFSLHKVTALVAAVVVTMGVQGSMLASFDSLAVAPLSAQANATCTAVAVPAVEVAHARS